MVTLDTLRYLKTNLKEKRLNIPVKYLNRFKEYLSVKSDKISNILVLFFFL